MNNNEKDNLSREEHIINYAKSLDEIDKAMQPFKDHKAALKEMYKDNGWLSKEEMSAILRAYRSLKNNEDLSEILEYCDMLKGKVSP